MLEKDFAYYLQNKNTLVDRFGKGFLIIQNQNILKSFPDLHNAIQFAESNKGHFLIQEVSDKNDGQTALIVR